MIEINEQILKDINRNFIIPPKPEILTELQNLIATGDAPIADAAKVVVKDLAISSAILKIINSPAYGLSRTVADIKQAVMFLGWDGVNALAQGLKLKEMFATDNSCISLERFWDTSTEIANVNMMIGQRLKKQIAIEPLYTLGLFHDCGVPPMAIKYDNYLTALHCANQTDKETIIEIEERLYKTNHAVVGYYFANSWHLPKEICQLILNHHNAAILAEVTDTDEQICFAILKMSENLVTMVRRGSPIPQWGIIESKVLDVLHLNDDEYCDLQEDVIDFLNNLS
ncbi:MULTISPECIES: HDOD domain-containing protein [Pseudoalteromonas]|uniref:HDOD domain-containing protein n=1 Tax=Pseudoalteromonas rhizosphaerae TaxID=2518973 RepID=A0ABW8L5V6_9GAMM